MPTDTFLELPRDKNAPRASDSNARRVRTLRMLAAQIEWLSGARRWQEGRIVWMHSRGALMPGAADLSAAQRALHQVARYPRAGDRAFGDGAAWLKARQAQLEEAKRLHLIQARDLTTLASERSPAAIGTLVDLLCAEAVCQNTLPTSPSLAMMRAAKGSPQSVTTALRILITDENAPRAGRALAALVLGALSGDLGSLDDSWIIRAHRWGVGRGLPDEPGLAIVLLGEENGTILLQRFQEAAQGARDFALPVDSLREMLFSGVSAERVVALCEAMAQAQGVAARLTGAVMLEVDATARRFGIEEERLRRFRAAVGQRCQKQRERLAQLARNLAIATRDSDVPRLIMEIMEKSLAAQASFTSYVLGSSSDALQPFPFGSELQQALDPQRPLDAQQFPLPRPALPRREVATAFRIWNGCFEFALEALRGGQSLAPELQMAYLRLLREASATIWEPLDLSWGRRKATPAQRSQHLRRNLGECWKGYSPALVSLLESSGDPSVCLAALQRGVHVALGRHRFRDPALYPFALDIMAFLSPSIRWTWGPDRVCEVVARFATLNEARASLRPLLDALGALPPDSRGDGFNSTLSTIGDTREALRTSLPRLAPHLRTLFAYLSRAGRGDHLWEGIEALVALEGTLRVPERRVFAALEAGDDLTHDAETPPNAVQETEGRDTASLDVWLEWLLDEARKVRQTRDGQERNWFPLGLVTRVCATLSEGDLTRFQSGFRVLSRTEIEDTSRVESGLDLLHRYPRLRAALFTSLAQRPGRVLRLLSRLGLSRRLGTEALLALDVWKVDTSEEARVPPDELPEEWRAFLAPAPDLASLAGDYIWSQNLRGEDAGVPSSLRRALELPRKLRDELSHLETLVAAHPERSALSLRAVTLRARLADSHAIEIQALAGAREKLQTLTREARLSAGEGSVERCFRTQLQFLAGRLPDSLALDDDWLNAVLLSIDIPHNRKLLRRLLRARASGDLTWSDRQAANLAWLGDLSERGADIEAWQGGPRKRFRLPGLPGERVYLRVERDPLQILQMGNAFGTCLSAGNINAFSTVANAADANKRVVFARDASGRIVARKLLAVNAEGALVGFYTYVSGSNEAVNSALREVMARYAREFAARCRLALADAGEVPLLLAEQWYNDGIVPWSRDQAAAPASISLES